MSKVINLFDYKKKVREHQAYHFTKEERMDATEHLLYDDDTYLEDFLANTSIVTSIERGFKEIKQFKEGKTQFKTLKESQALWDKWVEKVDDEEIKKFTTADLMLSPQLREKYYQYWDNKIAEDKQNPKLKEIFEEEDKIYKEMRELGVDEKNE